MKRNIIQSIVLIAIMGATVSFVACVNKDKAPDTGAATEQFEPDGRFANMDSLIDCMRNNELGDQSLDELIDHYQATAAAIKSYWHFNHQNEDSSRVIETVFNELTARADSLSGGSTMDMVESNEIRNAITRYLTAEKYCEKNSGNDLYKEEMRAWLELEGKLHEFYGDLAQLANWGGSIVNVVNSGTLANLASVRWQDYGQLAKGGRYALCEMSINDARTEFIHEIEDAKSLEDDLVDEEGFKQTLNDMRKAGDELIPLLDKWLATRAKLSESEGILESHTAHVIEFLASKIQVLIEG